MTTAKINTTVPFSASSKSVKSKFFLFERDPVFERAQNERGVMLNPFAGPALMKKECGPKIEFCVLPETPAVLLDNYNELFDLICDTENQMREPENQMPFGASIESGGSGWSFIIHSPCRVESFYHNRKENSSELAIDAAIQEAYEKHLSLVEIRTDDCANPQYIAITRTVDIYGLKKKWCQSYCKFHELALSEIAEAQDAPPIS